MTIDAVMCRGARVMAPRACEFYWGCRFNFISIDFEIESRTGSGIENRNGTEIENGTGVEANSVTGIETGTVQRPQSKAETTSGLTATSFNIKDERTRSASTWTKPQVES
ncbi:hypothetical protein EVAR_8522_1 [Eumeta japonica]|uniref:Uncharacterized protein n=1 Tax=Eumeta variegata TaxID=151549 RepID=A0A4C1TXG5_EUMVA|nr:hypothetical protein EVAR_8522_1 [Eumeta japonica]